MIEMASVRHRMLGGALRAYRLDQGLDLDGAAGILECDRSKISRIETGMRGIRPKELRDLLAEYGVSEPERDALAGIARLSTAGGWWQDHADVLTRTDLEYLRLEASADRIEVYEPQLVPALLQSPGYADAVTEAWPAAGQPGGSLATLTLARQDAFAGKQAVPGRHCSELVVLIDEAVLHRPVGAPEVMHAQLQHLCQAADGGISGITLRVLPLARGVRAAGGCGPVTILRFADAPRIGLVYLPSPGRGGTCLVGQDDVTAYTRTLTNLTGAALTPGRSAQLLHDLAASYNGSGTRVEAAS